MKFKVDLTIPIPEPDPTSIPIPLGSGSPTLKPLGGTDCANIVHPPHRPAPESNQAAGSPIGDSLDWSFAGAFAGFNIK